MRTLRGHSDSVNSVALSSDGRHIVSGSADDTVKVWALAAGACVRTLEGHSRPVSSVAVSSDGRQIVSGSGDETVKVWPMRHGRRVPHCLLRKQVAATNAMAHGDLDRQLAVLERQLHLERRLLQFVYDGRSDVDGGAPAAEDSVLPDDLFPLFCQFLVG